MHSYSTDSRRRLKSVALLGALSFVVIQTSEQVLVGLSFQGFTLPVLIPSFTLVFGAIFLVCNRYIWRLDPVQSVGLVKIPNLNGKWTGYVKTSYSGTIPESQIHPDNEEESDYTKIRASLSITQQWWRIQVDLRTDGSSSHSEGATLLVEDTRWPTLSYQYENTPSVDTPDGMQLHYGTTNLQLSSEDETDVLTGAYYTGPQRENHGELYFERDSQ